MKKISKDMIIMDLIKVDEGIISILYACGMHCIGCMAAHGETLGEAALVHGIDPDELEAEINAYLATVEE